MDIPIKNIYYLLSYAWDKLEEAESLNISLSDYDNALNLITRLFVARTKFLIKKGLRKSYVSLTEEYPGIKGRIEFKESLNKNHFYQGKSICTFDDFSTNIIHNQIIKSVLNRLLSFKELDDILRQEVKGCYYKFTDVDDIIISGNDLNSASIHRNNIEYDFLIKLSRLIIDNSTINEDNGGYNFVDFTRNDKAMAYLFEKFVFNFYKREQSNYKVRREDISWNAIALNSSDLKFLPKMQTDISLEANHRKIIIDTKYYKQTLSFNYSNKIRSNNLYQIIALLFVSTQD